MAETALAPVSQSSDANLIAALVAAGGVAFLGYKYWYLPNQAREYQQQIAAARQQYERQILQQQQSTGQSRQDAIAALGSGVCKIIGMAHGVPPQLSGFVCDPLGKVASDVIKTGASVSLGVAKFAGKAGTTLLKFDLAILKAGGKVVMAPVKAIGGAAKAVGKVLSSIF